MPSICFQTLLYSYNVKHKTHINKEENSLGDLTHKFSDEFPSKGWGRFIPFHHHRSAYHCASRIYEGGHNNETSFFPYYILHDKTTYIHSELSPTGTTSTANVLAPPETPTPKGIFRFKKRTNDFLSAESRSTPTLFWIASQKLTPTQFNKLITDFCGVKRYLQLT